MDPHYNPNEISKKKQIYRHHIYFEILGFWPRVSEIFPIPGIARPLKIPIPEFFSGRDSWKSHKIVKSGLRVYIFFISNF